MKHFWNILNYQEQVKGPTTTEILQEMIQILTQLDTHINECVAILQKVQEANEAIGKRDLLLLEHIQRLATEKPAPKKRTSEPS